MAIITSPALVVSPPFAYAPHHPLVGWRNVVTRLNVTADSAETAYPVSNLGNANSALWWLSASTAEQLVTLSDLNAAIDYVGLARHNFGTGLIQVSVEGILAEPGETWEVLLGPVQLADDAPTILRFAKAIYSDIRLRLVPTAIAPRAAVLFCGDLTAIQPGIAPGYVPLPRALDVELFNGRSERGEYLGSIIEGAELGSSASFRDIDPDYYASLLKPFVYAANRGAPFFFVWAPEAFPDEVAFGWLSRSAQPSVSRATGQIDLTLDMKGLAL